MKSVLLLALVLGVVSASPLLVKTPCTCTPDQWEGFASSFAGLNAPGILTQYIHVHYDYTNKRVAFRELEEGYIGKQPIMLNLSVLVRDGTLYIVDNKKQTCHKQAMPNLPQACIPSDARLLSTSYAGLGQLKMRSYGGQVSNPQVNATYALSITDEECIPVGEMSFGQAAGNIGFTQIYGYFNNTAGIKSQSVFDIPSACQGSGLEFHTKPELSGVMKALASRYLKI